MFNIKPFKMNNSLFKEDPFFSDFNKNNNRNLRNILNDNDDFFDNNDDFKNFRS